MRLIYPLVNVDELIKRSKSREKETSQTPASLDKNELYALNAINNLIAIAEVLPTVDLNLPRGIVLAAMYDKTADSLKMLNDLIAISESCSRPRVFRCLSHKLCTPSEILFMPELRYSRAFS